MKFTFSLGAIIVVILLVALAVSPAYGGGRQGGGNGQVISVFGEIPGRDLLVHLWAVVPTRAKSPGRRWDGKAPGPSTPISSPPASIGTSSPTVTPATIS